MRLWVEKFDGVALRAFAKLAEAGFVVYVHCEDESIVVDVDVLENRTKSLYAGNIATTKFALDDL